MDAQRILDQLLNAGRDLAQQGEGWVKKGEDLAAEKLGVGSDAESRQQMRKSAAGGALAAGAMALLLGTGVGRAIGGSALRLGGVAALGTLAWTAYKNWQAERNGTIDAAEEATTIDALPAPEAEKRARALLSAMIAAAKADGHIDDTERAMIETRMRGFEGADMAFFEEELRKRVSPEAVAAQSDSPQAAREIYAVSVMVCGADHPSERRYLDDLARALGLERGIARAIEAEMTESEPA